MELTEDEVEVVECLREWAEDPHELQLTVSRKGRIWECLLLTARAPEYFAARGLAYDPTSVAARGVGTSFVEAFRNIAGGRGRRRKRRVHTTRGNAKLFRRLNI
jgi:hypothetical protein